MFRAVTFAIAKYAQVVLQIFIVELADVAEKDQGEYWIAAGASLQRCGVNFHSRLPTPEHALWRYFAAFRFRREYHLILLPSYR